MARQKAIREKYFINLNGQQIEVSQEVYYAYYGDERKERYLDEQDKKRHVFVFSALEEKDRNLLEFLRSAENIEEDVERQEKCKWIRTALQKLPQKDQNLIDDLFYLEKTLAQVAEENGVSESAIRQRKSTVLKKLRKILSKE